MWANSNFSRVSIHFWYIFINKLIILERHVTTVLFFVGFLVFWFATQTPLQGKKDKWRVLISVTNCVCQALCSKTKHQQKQKPVYTVWHQQLTHDLWQAADLFCVAVLECSVAVWTKCSWLFPSLAGQKTWFFGVKLSLQYCLSSSWRTFPRDSGPYRNNGIIELLQICQVTCRMHNSSS